MNVLYILMRTDLASMNPGKAIAQGSHATSAFHRIMENTVEMEMHKGGHKAEGPARAYMDWIRQANCFGTVLTLGCNEQQMRDVIGWLSECDDDSEFDSPVVFGIINDPTYPIRDGEVTHYIPLDTCAYVFGDKDELSNFLGHLDLHP